MKRTIVALGLAFAVLLVVPTPQASAGGAKCYRLKDPDAKNLCLARSTRDIGKCGLIKHRDLAQYCRATVRRSRGMCVMIKSPKLKKKCLAEVK